MAAPRRKDAREREQGSGGYLRVRKAMENSRMPLQETGATRSGRDSSPETGSARWRPCVRGVVDLVNKKKKGKHQWMRHDVEKKKKETGGARRLCTDRSLRNPAAAMAEGELPCEQPGGS